MSNKLNFQQGMILGLFFLFGFASTYYFENYLLRDNKTSRVVFNTKLGKQLSFVNIQMELVDLADNDQDTSEIKAYVTLLKSTNSEISYSWNVPESVLIVSGNKEGSFSDVATETPQEITLKVSGFSKKEKKLITLNASTKIGDNVFGNVGLISSRPQDSYEFIANKNYSEPQQIDLSSQSPLTPPRDEKIQR